VHGYEASPKARTLELWHALDRLSAGYRGWGFRVYAAGFAAACISGAAVLTSGYFLGTAWAGPWAAAIPVAVGLAAALAVYAAERAATTRKLHSLRSALLAAGADPDRPTATGLGLYYDPQLILLRSEYELLLLESKTSRARHFEQTFGFHPQDGFETGPLNVMPDEESMRRLRRRWEGRLGLREGPPATDFRRAVDYQLYPKEMSVPAELAVRHAYLEISWHLLKNRYGTDERRWRATLPEDLYRRAVRDRRELDTLSRKPPR
jgi:hypothetical protein